MSGTGLPTIAGLLCLLSVPALTWASSVTVKAGGGSGGSTAAAPVGEYENAALSTNLDLSKVLSLDLSLTGTHDDTVPVAPGKRFGNSGENIVGLSAGLSWSPDDHLSLDIGASYSPKTSSTFDTPITVGSMSGQQDGLLSSTVRSWGADIAVGYDTAGESAFESTFSTEASFTHLSSLQGLQEIVTSTGTTNLTRLRAECADNATGVCRRLRPLFRNRPVDLRQVAVGASYTATIQRRTSLSLGGTYYDYLGDDPTQIGFFSVALVGRGAGRRPHGHNARGSTLSFGEGVPLAPLSYSVNGGVAQELGALSLALTAGYGNDYGGAGNNKNLALRASLGLSSAWKLILTVSGNRDADQDGSRTDSVVASLGLRYRF